MNIQTELQQIGLNKSEISIYTFLIQNGTSSVQNVSRETKISRTNCYYVFKQLTEKGLIEETEIKKKRFYKPLDPSAIVNYTQKNLIAAQRLLPDLYGALSYNKNKPAIRFTESADDFISLLGQILLSSELTVLGNTDVLEHIVPSFSGYFTSELRAKGAACTYIQNAALPLLTIQWNTNITYISRSEPYTATTITNHAIAEQFNYLTKNVPRGTKLETWSV